MRNNLCDSSLEIWISCFLFGNMLFSMLTCSWMAVSCSQQNIIIFDYLVDIRSEAWLNLFGEYIHGKLFAVHGIAHPISSLESDWLDGWLTVFCAGVQESFYRENVIGQAFFLLIVYCWLVYANYEMEFHNNTLLPCSIHPSSSFHHAVDTHTEPDCDILDDFLWHLAFALVYLKGVQFSLPCCRQTLCL